MPSLFEAHPSCISERGVQKHGLDLSTSKLIGCFKDDPILRHEFLATVSVYLKP
nr:GTP cyclohydrolase I [Bradyrhizobium guangzhouense]